MSLVGQPKQRIFTRKMKWTHTASTWEGCGLF